MVLLDTDRASVLKMPGGDRRDRLVGRITLLDPKTVSIPVIAAEEMMRGWLAAVAKERDARRQVFAYRELASMFCFFAGFEIVTFDDAAVERFEQLIASKIRIGTMDLKIAAIALAQNALLLYSQSPRFRASSRPAFRELDGHDELTRRCRDSPNLDPRDKTVRESISDNHSRRTNRYS